MLNQILVKPVKAPMQPIAAVSGARERSLAGAFATLGAVMRFDRNNEIYGEAEPAEYFY